MGLLTDVNFAMHSVPEDGHYEAWKAKKDERLNKVHSWPKGGGHRGGATANFYTA